MVVSKLLYFPNEFELERFEKEFKEFQELKNKPVEEVVLEEPAIEEDSE